MRRFRVIQIILAVAYASSAIAAEHYSITELGTLGLDESRATGINSAGTVVGYAETFHVIGKREVRPFIYSDGVTIDLHDAVVGAMPKGCHLYNNVHPTITESGVVLGWLDCGGVYRWNRRRARFSYHEGTVDITRWNGSPGYQSLLSNAQHQIVENVGKPGRERAFLHSGDQSGDIGTLGGTPTKALGINNNDVIVGASYTGKTQHAFVWENGVMRDLNQLLVGPQSEFVILYAAEGINDAGTIVANGSDSRRAMGSRAYLLTPVLVNR